MSDLISREALLKKYCKEPAKGNCKQCDWYGDSWCRCEIFGTQIAEAPAVDAVEVVRCKDCKHFGGHGACHCHAADENGTPIFVREDDFCSYGERKDNE